MVNRYLDVDVRVVYFWRFWAQIPSSIPPGALFPPVSGFWALTVNMRLFEKRGVLNRRGRAFWCSDAARGAGEAKIPAWKVGLSYQEQQYLDFLDFFFATYLSFWQNGFFQGESG